MLNKCCFIGRLGSEPEKRSTSNQNEVTNFTIACTEKYKDKSGARHEDTQWVKCNCWGNLSNIASTYLKKGSLVYVEGKWKTRDYEKNGEKRYITELHVNNLIMLDSKQQSQQSDPYAQPPRQNQNQRYNDDFLEPDIPF